MPTIVLTFTSGKDYLLEKLYFQNSSIYLDNTEQEAFDSSRNELMKFLERDEREALKMDTQNTEEGEADSIDTKYKWPF